MRNQTRVTFALCLFVAWAVLALHAAFPNTTVAAVVQPNVLCGVGDFEYEGGKPGVGGGWYCIPTEPPEGTFELDDTTSVTGKRSQRINIPSQPTNGKYYAAILCFIMVGAKCSVEEGDDLRLSAYIKTTPSLENGRHSVWISLSDEDPNTRLPFESKPVVLSEGGAVPQWTRVETLVKIPSGARKVALFFNITQESQSAAQPPSGALWVDNVEAVITNKTVEVPVKPVRQMRIFSYCRTEPDLFSFARKVDFCVANHVYNGPALQFKRLRPDGTAIAWRPGILWGYNVTAQGTPQYHEYVDPEWILRDRTGKPVDIPSMGVITGCHYTDMGHPAFQREWVQKAVDLTRRRGFDGVGVDALTGSDWGFSKLGFGPDNPLCMRTASGEVVPKYRNSAEWTLAEVSFVKNVSQGIKAAVPSAKFILNSGCGGDWREYPWSEFIKYADGVVNECAFFSADDSEMPARMGNYAGLEAWRNTLRNMTMAAAMPKPFIYIAQTRIEEGDTPKLRFSLASYLLGAYHSSFFGENNFHMTSWDDLNHVFYSPDYDMQIGDPTGPYQQDPSGVYVRRFTNGLVVVNPDETNSRTYQLAGSYVDLDGRTVEPGPKALGPISALILLSKSSVGISITADRSSVKPGGVFTYTVTYRNAGSRTATDVNIELPLTPEVSFVSATGGGVYESVSNKVLWVVPGIGPGEKGQFLCTVRLRS